MSCICRCPSIPPELSTSVHFDSRASNLACTYPSRDSFAYLGSYIIHPRVQVNINHEACKNQRVCWFTRLRMYAEVQAIAEYAFAQSISAGVHLNVAFLRSSASFLHADRIERRKLKHMQSPIWQVHRAALRTVKTLRFSVSLGFDRA